MRQNLFACLVALTVSTGACVMSADTGPEDATLLVVNDSSYVLTEVRIAPVGDRSWGPNLLPDVLFPGEELLIVDIECDTYDVLVTDETGVDCVLGNVDLCFNDDTWVVTDFTLDVCAFAN